MRRPRAAIASLILRLIVPTISEVKLMSVDGVTAAGGAGGNTANESRGTTVVIRRRRLRPGHSRERLGDDGR